MYHLSLTPAATVGLFVAHRMYQPKGVEQMRASLDTERLFFKEAGGLVSVTEKGGISSAAIEKVEVAVENHIHEHLKRAITAALDEGKAFGFLAGQASPLHGTEAFDAVEKAEKRDAPAKPVLVEKPSKKTASA